MAGRYWHTPGQSGKLHAADTGVTSMRFIPEQCRIIYTKRGEKSPSVLAGRWPLENDEISLKLEEERNEDNPAYRFSFSVKAELFVEEIVLNGRLDGTLRPVSALTEGFQSRSTTGIATPDIRQKSLQKQSIPGHSSPWGDSAGKGGEAVSESLLLLDDGLNESLLISQEAPFSEFVFFEAGIQQQPVKLNAHWHLSIALELGSTYTTGWVSTSSGTGEKLLIEWSRRSSKASGINCEGFTTPPRIWTSCMDNSREAGPDYIEKNISTAAGSKLPLDVFLIDAGWEEFPGDWHRPSPAFEGRLPQLARSAAAAGFRPGISIAPFIAARNSEAFKQPGWILCNVKGKPVPIAAGLLGRKLFTLDLSNPEVINYISSSIRTITRDWGFQTIKLDMLFAGTLPGMHSDQTKGIYRLFTEAMQIIREAAGKETLLIGSGMPLTGGAGTIDIAGISCGDASLWDKNVCLIPRKTNGLPALQSSVRSTIIRSFYNRQFWLNDPGLLLTEEPERDVLLTAALVTGGALSFGDNLAEMSEESLEKMKSILEKAQIYAQGRTAPLRIFGDSEVFALYNDTGLILLFNLNSEEVTIELRLAGYRDILSPYTAYKPFTGAEDHPLEAPRNMTIPAVGYKEIRLS